MSLWRRAAGVGLALTAAAAVVLVIVVALAAWLFIELMQVFDLGPNEG